MNATINTMSTLRTKTYPTGEFFAVPDINLTTKVKMNGLMEKGTIRYFEMELDNIFQEMAGMIVDIRTVGNNLEYPILIGNNGNIYSCSWAVKDLIQLPLNAVVDLDAKAIPFKEIGGSWRNMIKVTVIEKREGEIRLQFDRVAPAPIGEDDDVVINSAIMIFTNVPC